MLVETIKRYIDKETGKFYENGDLRDVPSDRGFELIKAGVAKSYSPIKDNKEKPKTKTGGVDKQNS